MKLRTFVPAVAAFAATAASASIPPAYEKFLPREQRAGSESGDKEVEEYFAASGAMS